MIPMAFWGHFIPGVVLPMMIAIVGIVRASRRDLPFFVACIALSVILNGLYIWWQMQAWDMSLELIPTGLIVLGCAYVFKQQLQGDFRRVLRFVDLDFPDGYCGRLCRSRHDAARSHALHLFRSTYLDRRRGLAGWASRNAVNLGRSHTGIAIDSDFGPTLSSVNPAKTP